MKSTNEDAIMSQRDVKKLAIAHMLHGAASAIESVSYGITSTILRDAPVFQAEPWDVLTEKEKRYLQQRHHHILRMAKDLRNLAWKLTGSPTRR